MADDAYQISDDSSEPGPAELLEGDQQAGSRGGGSAYAFVVRLWVEGSGQQQTAWHGLIEDVRKGKQLYFNDLSGILRFISEQTGVGRKQLHPWQQFFSAILHHER